MLIHNNDYSQNGHEREVSGGRPLYISPKHNDLFNLNPRNKRMEPALKLWLGIFYGTGFMAYISAIFLNIGTWKSDLLFGVAFLFGVARLIFYVVKQLQLRKLREIEIEEKERHLHP